MANNINNKKALAEKLKNELNSLNYIAMSDLISGDDYAGHILAFPGRIWNTKQKGSIESIRQDQLEPSDWQELVDLIDKRNEEREKIWETKKKKIEEKLNSQSGLYYYWGKQGSKPKRADGWHPNKNMRGYSRFLGAQENGLNYCLYIAEEHPILNNFSFQAGFYLINDNKPVEKNVGTYEGGFACSGGETNPGNWQKYVEVGDQITITPYETKELSISIVHEFFLEWNVKEIEITSSGNLFVEYNNGKSEVIKNKNDEKGTKIIKDNLKQILNREKISQQELENLWNDSHSQKSTSPTNSPKSSYIPYLISGIVAVVLIGGGLIIYRLKSRKKN